MTKFYGKICAALILGTIALAGIGCTKDKMMGHGGMKSDSDSMDKTSGGKDMSQDKGMMKQ
jgi:hypothetical protein